LNHIETAMQHALAIWQQVKKLQELGMRGGDPCAEAQARAAVFQLRAMWLSEYASTLQQSSTEQEGIPRSFGTGLLPPGLERETDLNAVKQRRIEALQFLVEARQARKMSGLDDIALVCSAQIELANAKLESTTVKNERLNHIETALRHALTIWQRVKKMQEPGMKSAEAAPEAQARAAVFKFREIWLTEQATAP
jgi:hypothetical protein